jgi:hypothetical protein
VLGIDPDPRTLWYPYKLLFNKGLTAFTTLITAAWAAVEALRASSGTSVQSFERLIVGLKYWLR